MPIKEVTYHQVVCDAPDCKTTTADLGDYSAWGDAGDAIDQWNDWDGVVLDDGRAFCEKHSAPYLCVDCGEDVQQPLTPGSDGEYRCTGCQADLDGQGGEGA